MQRRLFGVLGKLCGGLLFGGLLLGAGACTALPELSEEPCPPIGTFFTYQNFGAAFMSRYCQSCHGSQSPDRAGAPPDFVFDTVAQIRQHRARIYMLAASSNPSTSVSTTNFSARSATARAAAAVSAFTL